MLRVLSITEDHVDGEIFQSGTLIHFAPGRRLPLVLGVGQCVCTALPGYRGCDLQQHLVTEPDYRCQSMIGRM